MKITVGAQFRVAGARSASEGVGAIMTLFATTEKDKPAVGGEIIFTGATIYFMLYAETSTKENVADEDKIEVLPGEFGENAGQQTNGNWHHRHRHA